MELENLYQEYAEMIYRFIWLKCRDRELAEDIVQSTFLKAIQRIDSFHGECKISTWLCYSLILELTGQDGGSLRGELEGYRISDRFIYISGTARLCGDSLPSEVSSVWETMWE